MKAAVYRGPGVIEWSSWPDPVAGASEIRVEPLVTHRLPLSRLAEAVQLTLSRQALKVFLTGVTS